MDTDFTSDSAAGSDARLSIWQLRAPTILLGFVAVLSMTALTRSEVVFLAGTLACAVLWLQLCCQSERPSADDDVISPP